jgi:hypothetical protein
VNVEPGTPCLYPILTATNSGATGPVASTYSDSFDISIGTSFSAPLVSGVAALVLSARPALAPAQVRQILQATARPFPATGSGPEVVACTAPRFTPGGAPVDQLECYCTTSTCGAGMVDAGAAVQAAAAGLPSSDFNVQGLWWNAPADSESGWGINFAHQGEVVFATWFTYDAAGRAWWLSMTANKVGPNTYAGELRETRAVTPGTQFPVTGTVVGNATLNFTGNDTGTFSYTVNGISQAKTITRQVFGVVPACVFALHPPLADATNYQDLWWAYPAGSQSGWGINLTMQSNVIFATWFTYDPSGAPVWLSGAARQAAPGEAYAGTLYRTTGPPFNAVPFDPAAVQRIAYGTFSLSFGNGNLGTFTYVVGNASTSLPITRQVFRTPGTACN